MADPKKENKSIKTLAEDLRKFRERRRKLSPQQIKELNDLLDDRKSARPPETEL